MPITVTSTIEAPIEHVWKCFTEPEHITKWNFAADTWCCPSATNDVSEGGSFSWRMEAKDGSFGFDLEGTYTKVESPNLLDYTLADGRKVNVRFTEDNGSVRVDQSFEPETQNSQDLQRQGWQAILHNFGRHASESYR